ncbi:tricarballylate utilization 4Fe-4S protein TcuB [Roseospirillum parvum]|uniref:Citrate/tricarballylate utilization protein n=1 Tax=Roseospirillum parvum TaxID=83401 RepID=A0A1G8ATG9_9PROT|nr:tricarballylate utilization 4Fe-4S protein TcuB [Roseospirillum parvum]SDH24301.1 citrate/tricarballylate utilization protein [Roseospirillum parvum]
MSEPPLIPQPPSAHMADPLEPLGNPLDEARRQLAICNVCKYCNGFCPVFAAAEQRAGLSDGDLLHLAHLCHNCRNCWYACQYAPPNPFAVNLPRALARVRMLTYRAYAWPGEVAGPGWLALLLALAVPVLTVFLVPAEVLFASHQGPGAFYAVIPWGVLTGLAAVSLGGALVMMAVGMARYWRDTGGGSPLSALKALPRALKAVALLKHMNGGGVGCNDVDGRFSRRRRWLHQSLLGGLLLCLAATLWAAAWHHFLGREAPYPLTSPPVLLGTVGGGLMTLGSAGLMWLKRRADPEPADSRAVRAEWSLLGQLLAVALSGLALLAWRDSAAMGLLLALHLGIVLGFFFALPFGKLAHAPYRLLSLIRAVMDTRDPPP